MPKPGVRVGGNFPRMKKESPEKQFELRNGHKLLWSSRYKPQGEVGWYYKLAGWNDCGNEEIQSIVG